MELLHRDKLTRLYRGYTIIVRALTNSVPAAGYRPYTWPLHNTLPCFEGESRSWTGGHESCSPCPMCRLLSHAPSERLRQDRTSSAQQLHRRNSNFLLRPIYNARIVLIPDDKHNENEIQVDASFKRIVNGINTRQIAIPSRGRNLSKRKSFSYFLKKKKKKIKKIKKWRSTRHLNKYT